MADEEWKKLREFADQYADQHGRNAVKQIITDELRENNGELLRWLLDNLRDHPDPECRTLYERLLVNPELRNLIPH